jgi:hypothetical protein
MAGLYVPKRRVEFDDVEYGVCLWRKPDGSYIANDDGDYLSIQGRVGDVRLEEKLRKAAAECGVYEGEPVWLPGFRKITDGEWEDQMDRLLSGKIPDLADLFRQLK